VTLQKNILYQKTTKVLKKMTDTIKARMRNKL